MRRSRADSSSASRGCASAANLEQGLAEADVVVTGEYRTQVVLHNSLETHQAVVQWLGDSLEVFISTQYIWGVRDSIARQARPARRQGARRLQLHGRRLRLEERAGRLHVHRDRARAADAPTRSVRADAARGEPRDGQPQRHHAAPDDRRPRRRHAHGARRRLRELDRLGRLVVTGRRADADALRLRERQDHDLGGEDQPAADEGVPRPRVRRGDVRARVAARRARGPARHRPARAPPPQPREPRRRPTAARTAARTCSSATGAPSLTGSAGTRCAHARPAR